MLKELPYVGNGLYEKDGFGYLDLSKLKTDNSWRVVEQGDCIFLYLNPYQDLSRVDRMYHVSGFKDGKIYVHHASVTVEGIQRILTQKIGQSHLDEQLEHHYQTFVLSLKDKNLIPFSEVPDEVIAHGGRSVPAYLDLFFSQRDESS